MSYIIHIHGDHEIINIVYGRSQGSERSVSLPEFGLWCPIGERDVFMLEQKYKDTFKHKMGYWVLEVVDEKKWLITKIKYGI